LQHFLKHYGIYAALAAFIAGLSVDIVRMYLRRRRNQFPEPDAHNMTWEKFEKYSRSIPAHFAGECLWIVYRLDPARAPFPSIIKSEKLPEIATIRRLMYPDEWYWNSEAAKHQFDALTAEPRPFSKDATFVARIQRTWKNAAGLSETAEVGICTFTLGFVSGSVPGEPARRIDPIYEP
jgi:hypothetical protein